MSAVLLFLGGYVVGGAVAGAFFGWLTQQPEADRAIERRRAEHDVRVLFGGGAGLPMQGVYKPPFDAADRLERHGLAAWTREDGPLALKLTRKGKAVLAGIPDGSER